MSEIHYINLFYLLNEHPEYIEKIKDSYLLLLSDLSVTTYLETSLFISNLERISKMGSIIIAYVGELEKDNFAIIASGTIIIEPKIIREGKCVGHIEDIVVTKEFRGLEISQKILNTLKQIAKFSNCYKVILDCSEEVKKVYIKNGLEVKDIQMVQYFD